MNNLSNFFKLNSPFKILSRPYYHSKSNKKYLYKDGKLINENIYYYPRHAEEPLPEPDTTTPPPKFFRIHRIRPVAGNPHWEKRILREFGIMRKPNVAVVKNIPENNARLWKIKHLIQITPVNFPHGEPTKDDINYTYLKENGDCVVIKNIDQLNKRFEAVENFEKDEKRLDGEDLRKDSRLKWLNHW